ncbi:hypothetical protein B0T22DRAFT_460796 [Podospora appendiculata]|uniref:Uncharacterized protein n=1 Tax=Podospora appendiculata TaxID=314037 RepID=A0AAE0XAE7_9PEZI|nr:hypothetical protein B0T22DRAFT_460796 [Podospora appendiculata]
MQSRKPPLSWSADRESSSQSGYASASVPISNPVQRAAGSSAFPPPGNPGRTQAPNQPFASAHQPQAPAGQQSPRRASPSSMDEMLSSFPSLPRPEPSIAARGQRASSGLQSNQATRPEQSHPAITEMLYRLRWHSQDVEDIVLNLSVTIGRVGSPDHLDRFRENLGEIVKKANEVTADLKRLEGAVDRFDEAYGDLRSQSRGQ